MARISRYSVAKTQRSYDPAGVNAVLGSTVHSSTEQWGTEATSTVPAYPPATATARLKPTS